MARRAQQLILAFLGSCVVDRHEEPIGTKFYIDFLAELGVREAVTRATLSRMVGSGMLSRMKVGRERYYGLTDDARYVVRKAGDRVNAAQPFAPSDDRWTLLSYTVPERSRRLRHQLRVRLAWNGFGLLRDGLWIASGRIDLDDIFNHLDGDDDVIVQAFTCEIIKQWGDHDFMLHTWDMDQIRGAHEEFLNTWDNPRPDHRSALTIFIELIADWLRLLRADPRLPTVALPNDWPAERSLSVFRQLNALYEADALAEFTARIAAQPNRGRPDVRPRTSD